MATKVSPAGPVGLTDPYLKTSRAKEHLESLRQDLQVFYESKPCRFSREDDFQNQRHIVRMKVRETPDKISLIAGDFFFNLRASLDQLVWYLAKLTLAYPRETQFPVLEKPDAALIKRRTKGVPVQALAVIEALQPYNTPNLADIQSHQLWRLNKMCNIDKHMRIPVHGSTGVVTLPIPIVANGFRFDDDLVMNIPLGLKGEMALDPPVSFKVVFGDLYWKISCDLDDFEAIYHYIANNVLPRFARFFT
jgi:hypothetical protein